MPRKEPYVLLGSLFKRFRAWHVASILACCSYLCPLTTVSAAMAVLDSSHAGSSEPSGSHLQARDIVQRAINQMGGATAWISIGNARADVSTQLGNREMHSVWTDDWSSGAHHFARRNSIGDQSATFTSTDDKKRSGVLPSSSRDSELDEHYPAVALSLALRSGDCTFTVAENDGTHAQTIPIDKIEILQMCIVTHYPVRVQRWTFSLTTGLPASLQLPISSSSSVARDKTIYFIEYGQSNSLQFPTAAKVEYSSGPGYTYRAVDTNFGNADLTGQKDGTSR